METDDASDVKQMRLRYAGTCGLLLAVFDDPQSTRAWDQGAVGEERLGLRLDSLAAEGVAILHDRRIQGTKANIDHIAVTSNGVGH